VRAILEAAAQVFEADGLEGATTDRIAARAGVSVGSLYQYFPSKEAIVATLVQCHVLEAGAALESVLEHRPGQVTLDARLAELVHAVVALHAHRPRLQQLLAHEAPVDAAHAHARVEAVHALAARLGEVLCGHREVRVRDPALAAHLVLETLLGLAHRFAIEPAAPGEPADPDQRSAEREAEIVRMLRGYLVAEP
jgi:AcrR family transcriptional regulator